jgi:hypothetical protein
MLLAEGVQRIPVGPPIHREAMSYVVAFAPCLILSVYGFRKMRSLRRDAPAEQSAKESPARATPGAEAGGG